MDDDLSRVSTCIGTCRQPVECAVHLSIHADPTSAGTTTGPPIATCRPTAGTALLKCGRTLVATWLRHILSLYQSRNPNPYGYIAHIRERRGEPPFGFVAFRFDLANTCPYSG